MIYLRVAEIYEVPERGVGFLFEGMSNWALPPLVMKHTRNKKLAIDMASDRPHLLETNTE